MNVEEKIKIAYNLILKGKSLVTKGERMLKSIIEKPCRVEEKKSSTKKSKLTTAQKQQLLERLK